jgi:MFS family permease
VDRLPGKEIIMPSPPSEPGERPAFPFALWQWFTRDFLGIFREFRLSYLPPLMVYFAAGVSGFTGIIEAFFVKDSLGLSASFLATLGFWAGLPWALKMPVGHLVDLYWRFKSVFVYLGAALMGLSLLIMVGLTGDPGRMAAWMPLDVWYILSALLAPIGFMFQDVVADAMTVEAVPPFDPNGVLVPEETLRRRHVTMQTLGRIAIVGGSAMVAGVGGWLAQVYSYERMFEISLLIPVLSVSGVILGDAMHRRRHRQLRSQGFDEGEVRRMLSPQEAPPSPNLYILVGSAAFVAVILTVGLSSMPFKEEIILAGSLAIIAFLMAQLLGGIDAGKRREIIGIAVVVFVFRAMPTAGAGASWWQIDVLGFDEAFFGTLRQISALLVILGMILLRGWMGRHSVPYVVVFLSLYGTVMSLPYIGMYYGLNDWTQAHLGFGARTIAIIDTMADSPMGQVAMIPMLAWIAREAPREQKATYFAVMAAFTNLALSTSNLATQYMNKIFLIERESYGELGHLLIAVTVIQLTLPVVTVAAVHLLDRRYRDVSRSQGEVT